jgi:hypothetical protein
VAVAASTELSVSKGSRGSVTTSPRWRSSAS